MTNRPTKQIDTRHLRGQESNLLRALGLILTANALITTAREQPSSALGREKLLDVSADSIEEAQDLVNSTFRTIQRMNETESHEDYIAAWQKSLNDEGRP